MHDTRTGCSYDQRADFEARGWLVLHAVVSDRDLAELNCIFDGLMMPFAGPPGVRRSGS
jgi:hypothetical protein